MNFLLACLDFAAAGVIACLVAVGWLNRRQQQHSPRPGASWGLHLTVADHAERDRLDHWLDARWNALTHDHPNTTKETN